MTTLEVAHWRMRTLRLTGEPFDSPDEVVGWLGAVQAQDYGPAKWSVGQRTIGASDAGIDRLFNAGAVLRTHVLRPTWHFVLPADIRWLLELTAPRVHQQNAYMYRREELDSETLRRSSTAIVDALRGGHELTRENLKVALERAGIAAPTRFRLAYMLMHAELNGLICSGALAGKQHTYALLDARAPLAQSRRLSREEALAELTLRYFTSHGPATVQDFRWWSNLTIADIKTGLALVGADLAHAEIDGATYWFASAAPTTLLPSPTVHLVQGYDEYVVGYGETKFALDASGAARATPHDNAIFNLIVLLDSQIAGHWKRTIKKDVLEIEVALYWPFDRDQLEALYDACGAHADFLGLPVRVSVAQINAGGLGERSWWAPRRRIPPADPLPA